MSTSHDFQSQLQQHLPLAVLKLNGFYAEYPVTFRVATALTACGIETVIIKNYAALLELKPVATALTACGIETI